MARRPFAMSFRENFRVRHRVRANTIATAINIGAPASYQRAVQAIRETNGVVTSVSDGNIMEAKAIIDGAGVGCEPASAASVAGVRQMRLAGNDRTGCACGLRAHWTRAQGSGVAGPLSSRHRAAAVTCESPDRDRRDRERGCGCHADAPPKLTNWTGIVRHFPLLSKNKELLIRAQLLVSPAPSR